MALLPNHEGTQKNKKTKFGMNVTYIMLSAELICEKFEYLLDWHGNSSMSKKNENTRVHYICIDKFYN